MKYCYEDIRMWLLDVDPPEYIKRLFLTSIDFNYFEKTWKTKMVSNIVTFKAKRQSSNATL